MQKTEPRAEQKTETRAEQKAETTQSRSEAEEKTGRVPSDEREQMRAGTRWRSALLYRKRAERVRVVTMATRTRPRRGEHLAPLTPLIRAVHARD